jgi:peptide subunit release factor 1 (eRF1)
MHRAVADRLLKLVPDDGWILLGGPAEACSDIENALSPRLKSRAMTQDSLHMRSRSPEIIDAARLGASRLRATKDASVIEILGELAGAGGKGAVGVVPTLNALKDRSVQSLFFSTRLMETYPDLAESLVRLALQQGAEIEQVSGVAAEKLDNEFDGVAARLRFVRQNEQAAS